MKLTTAVLCVLLFPCSAFAEIWDPISDNLIRLTYGPKYDYRDDFILTVGRLTETEWIYDAGDPVQTAMVATKKIDSYGTENTRTYTLGHQINLKASWSGDCSIFNEAPMFFVDLRYEKSDGSKHEIVFEQSMNKMPHRHCRSDGTAYADTDGKYRTFGIPAEDIQNIGKIKNIHVIIRRAVRNSVFHLESVRVTLGKSSNRKIASEDEPFFQPQIQDSIILLKRLYSKVRTD